MVDSKKAVHGSCLCGKVQLTIRSGDYYELEPGLKSYGQSD